MISIVQGKVAEKYQCDDQLTSLVILICVS